MRRSLTVVVGSNAIEGIDVCLSVVSVVCCQIKIFVTVRSLVQRSRIEYVCVMECDKGQK